MMGSNISRSVSSDGRGCSSLSPWLRARLHLPEWSRSDGRRCLNPPSRGSHGRFNRALPPPSPPRLRQRAEEEAQQVIISLMVHTVPSSG
ncbi:hypothetical protein SRHO_G00202120 [Serrasalmus rhombeus]